MRVKILTILMFSLGCYFTVLNAQNISVKGKVTDEFNNPLPGASILVKGTPKGVSSDFDGNYEIQAQQGDVLEFSFVGFQSQSRKVTGGRGKTLIINVLLKEDTQQLDDVVVVGYGTQKKANLTGTVNTVKAETIQGKAMTSLTNALQGVTPGVTVISRPGDVGNDMGSVNIRGRGNLGTASPLYIVDGIPVSAADFQRIYPGDIESISILKDAAASAIYGARAAYGVFLVTTKKGKEGKANISYNGYYGFQSPTILPKKLNAYNYATLLNEASVNSGKVPEYNQSAIDRIIAQDSPDLYPDNDWYGLVYRKAVPIMEHNINISGGGKTRYFVSGTVFQQESLVKGRILDRYNFRANTERDFTDKFTLGTTISYVKDDYKRGGNFSVMDLDRMAPLTVARHSDGSWGTVTGGNQSAVLAADNPLRKIAEYGRNTKETTRFNGALNAVWKPIKGLSVTGQLSYRTVDSKELDFENRVERIIGFISQKPLPGTDKPINKLTNTWESVKNIISQAYANYDFSLGKNDLSFMVGTQFEDYHYEWLRAARKDFPNNDLSTINAGSNKSENLENGGNIQERAFFSTFGRFKYAFDSKYLFEANIRADKSSQFPKENRLGIFPSFSAAYRISKENFMQNIGWLSDLKLRASWGQLGNVDNVGFYDYYDALALGSAYITGGVRADGAWPSIVVNKDMTWETVTMTNIGLDVSLFKNALNVQVDVFDKLTEDILLKLPAPYELGLIVSGSTDQRAAKNAGKVSNKGIEAMISYNGKIGEDFSYGISANVSKIWNKVVDLYGQDDQISGSFIIKEGEAIGSFYGYKADGLFVNADDVANHMRQDAATAAGDIKYADINGDNKFDTKDRTILGNDVPYFTYGIGLNFAYKGFDLSIQGQGVNDVLVHLPEEASQAFFNGAGAKEYHLGRWTAQNPDPNAAYPRLLLTNSNAHNQRFSSFWLYDADYFRIKSIIFGYTMPEHISQYIGCQKVRFYVSGTNLFTIRADKRLKDFDPEMASVRGTYPNMKNISFGVNLSF